MAATTKKKLGARSDDESASAKFGMFLKQKRLQAGLTVQEVSHYLGSSPQQLRAYESGEKPVPLNTIYALANCLNISPELVSKKLGARL